MSEQMLRVKYVKSCIGYSRRQKATIRALGLHKLGDVVQVRDSDAVRGMLAKVRHLVQVEPLVESS